eukprot:m.96011 g.96011  ORF g.96011 m.96011 type:complete len:615 (+) comp8959_c3_seq1:170-2014(+)
MARRRSTRQKGGGEKKGNRVEIHYDSEEKDDARFEADMELEDAFENESSAPDSDSSDDEEVVKEEMQEVAKPMGKKSKNKKKTKQKMGGYGHLISDGVNSLSHLIPPQLEKMRFRINNRSPTPSLADVEEVKRYDEIETIRKKTGVEDILPPNRTSSIPTLLMPAHAARDSMLSSSSGYTNYRGLFNLAIIALFVFGTRVVVENISKYGILVTPIAWFSVFFTMDSLWALAIFGFLYLCFMLAFAIEKAAASMNLSRKASSFLHNTLLVIVFFAPIVAVLFLKISPLHGFVAMDATIVTWMKMVSYYQLNKHYRLNPDLHARTSPIRMADRLKRKRSRLASVSDGEQADLSLNGKEQQHVHKHVNITHIRYPDNLTISNLHYFMAAPTLCYELNFPRNRSIRKQFLAIRIFETVFLLFLLIVFSQQWIMPTVSNTFNHDKKISLSYLLDRTLKLSVPNNILWLTLFYWYFHSVLNTMAELLRFADRQFYRDWWNSTTLSYFWKNWNIPVHKWCVRHLYRPVLEEGYSKITGQLVVFFLSAVLHEILVSVPLGLFKGWAFLAMVMQVPLVFFTEKFLNGTPYGNVIMWSSLFFGQPMAVMLYVQAFLAENSHAQS